MRKTLDSFIFISFILGSFLFGQLTHKNHLFVIEYLQEKIPIFNIENSIPPIYLETNAADLISIHEHKDVYKVRNRLINFLWGKPGIPLEKLPSSIKRNFKDENYADISSLSKIDKYTIDLDFDINSEIYHFIPKNGRHDLVLFHQGHRGSFILSKHIIKALLDQGFSVAAFSMPLVGNNKQPVFYSTRTGRLKLTNHEQFKFLRPTEGHAVKFFVEPVITILNSLVKEYSYRRIAMIGISGGGWTTTLASAVDPRIERSYSIAGGYPIFLRSESSSDWGDWEQTVPELYRQANYLELYILGAFGKNRKQIQVINKHDPCCFSGMKWQTYKKNVLDKMRQLDTGEWDLIMDDSHWKHEISQQTLAQILDDLNSEKQ